MFIKHGKTDFMLKLLAHKGLKGSISKRAKIASFKQSIVNEELGFTFILWNLYEAIYTDIDN